MRTPSRYLALVWLASLTGAACSSEPDREPAEHSGTVSQAITGKCQTSTYQLPCDPDGDGPLTECQGMCSPDVTGKMDCFAIGSLGLSNLDGRLCGDDTSCSAYCAGTSCVSGPA